MFEQGYAVTFTALHANHREVLTFQRMRKE
jgi:hypothetical protein